jgi:hypothetical protein
MVKRPPASYRWQERITRPTLVTVATGPWSLSACLISHIGKTDLPSNSCRQGLAKIGEGYASWMKICEAMHVATLRRGSGLRDPQSNDDTETLAANWLLPWGRVYAGFTVM